MSEPKVSQDAEERGEGICRTCLAPIWNEGGTIGRRKRDTGWSDRIERGGDSLVCFKAVEYRHVPLIDREAYIYDVALARGAGMTGEDFDRMLAARDADVRAQTLVQARQIAEVRAGVVAEEPERRAPVQASKGLDAGPAGTIAWSEHLEVWEAYARKHGTRQDAERIAARGGFGYGEIVLFTGRTPRTWVPVKQEGVETDG